MERVQLSSPHLLGLEGYPREDILAILDTARGFLKVLKQPIPKLPTLRGRTVLNLFFEPSTRTQASFDLAAKRLSADIVNISPKSSSVVKGEHLLDTLRNVEAMRVDAVVVRHRAPGVPHQLARHTRASVINAGDGAHEHPTQALLDLFTLREHFGDLQGLRVAIVGDILHSRVARSNIFGLSTLGAEVILVGPPTLVPREFEDFGNVRVVHRLEDDLLQSVDAVMALRIQKERLEASFFGSLREYHLLYGITRERARKIRGVLLHPGPVNWGVELERGVEEEVTTLILDQVTHGVAVRMAVLYLLLPPLEG